MANAQTAVSLVVMVFNVGLAALLIRRNPRGLPNWMAAGLTLACTLWAAEMALLSDPTRSLSVVLGAVDLGLAGWTLAGPVHALFALSFTGRRTWLRSPVIWLVLLGPIPFFWYGQWALGAYTSLGLTSGQWTNLLGTSWWDVAFFAHVFLTTTVALAAYGHTWRRAAAPAQRRLALRLAFSSFLAVLIAVTWDIGLPLALGRTEWPQIGVAGTLLWTGAVGFSLMRGRFLSVSLDAAVQTIADTVPDPLFLLDTRGRIVFANPAAHQLLGHPFGVLTGRPWATLAAEHSGDSAQENQPKPGQPSLVAMALRSHSGDEIPVLVSGAIVTDRASGAELGTVWVGKDFREYQQLQERLALANRMASVGQLAGGVAHEINNPLAVIMANLDIIRDGLTAAKDVPLSVTDNPKPDSIGAAGVGPTAGVACQSAELRACVDDSTECAIRIQKIVRDLTTFVEAPRERGGLVNVAEPVEDAARAVESEVRPRAQLVVEIEPVPLILAHPDHVTQILIKLLTNAAHAITPGAPQDNAVRVCTGFRDGRVWVAVRDSGCGIPVHERRRLFDPFFTTRPVGSGTGLGLTLCHTLAAKWGSGEISVESTVGQGSCFTVWFPRAADDAAMVSAGPDGLEPSDEPRPPVPARVLVVDDEPCLRRSLQRGLGAPECEVETAVSGRQAEDLLAAGAGDFSLILCDLIMANGTGMELYDWLQAHRPDLVAQTVFMTGGAFTAEAAEFIRRVAPPCVEKPLDLAALRELVSEYHGRVLARESEQRCG